jgi:hypothetical protein
MKTATYSGTTLFHIAAAEYLDASLWLLIARENQLTDPVISGVVTLRIPDPDPSQTGGIVTQQ